MRTSSVEFVSFSSSPKDSSSETSTYYFQEIFKWNILTYWYIRIKRGIHSAFQWYWTGRKIRNGMLHIGHKHTTAELTVAVTIDQILSNWVRFSNVITVT